MKLNGIEWNEIVIDGEMIDDVRCSGAVRPGVHADEDAGPLLDGPPGRRASAAPPHLQRRLLQLVQCRRRFLPRRHFTRQSATQPPRKKEAEPGANQNTMQHANEFQ